jgi:hypothetical protein
VPNVVSEQPELRDHISVRGELLFGTMITRYHPELGYRFEPPRHLGDKKRTIDFYVELISPGTSPAYFLAQVKATRQRYTVRETRLKVGIRDAPMRRLAAYPAPTYVIGIDERNERGYIVSANGERLTGFSSMSTLHPLTSATLAKLHAEVEGYWRMGAAGFVSAFVDDRWRVV